MTRTMKVWSPLAIAVATVAGATLPALANDHEAVEHETIKIKKLVHACEGEECEGEEHQRRVIVIGEGDDVHGLEGNDMTWVGHGGAHAFSLAHQGKGGFLGVASTELTPELRRHFAVPEETGVLVAKVVADSAAANAGVQVGDILTAVNGEEIESTRDLIREVRDLEPGAAIDLELYRDGTLQTLGATLGERQMPRRQAMLLHCEDDDEACPQIAFIRDFDCGGDSDCEVNIECRDEGCDCTVNGESTECETLPGFAAPGE